jgi:hypothetical protein
VNLRPGTDFRRPEYRREVWQRFYSFHLRYRAHPGGVYYVLPAMADAHGWDAEQRAWAAFLNGNTQNPVTTLLLMGAGDRPQRADSVLAYWRAAYPLLAWDTDRRHHKSRLDESVAGYVALTRGGQESYWRAAAVDGWPGVWRAATAIPTLGRLSAWSYLEYLRILRVGNVPDADTLLLGDRDGSRSHRNGLCLVTGRDEWMWWDRNPGFDGAYPPDLIDDLAADGESLFAEAQWRNPGHPDVGYLTLESALCTYKSWHRPRRRYANVYNDMLYDRLRVAEQRFGPRFDVIWQARRAALPSYLRLEDNPNDPGCVPAKQDHYLNTGEVIMMDRDWPCFTNGFAAQVAAGAFGVRPS